MSGHEIPGKYCAVDIKPCGSCGCPRLSLEVHGGDDDGKVVAACLEKGYYVDLSAAFIHIACHIDKITPGGSDTFARIMAKAAELNGRGRAAGVWAVAHEDGSVVEVVRLGGASQSLAAARASALGRQFRPVLMVGLP